MLFFGQLYHILSETEKSTLIPLLIIPDSDFDRLSESLTFFNSLHASDITANRRQPLDRSSLSANQDIPNKQSGIRYHEV